MQKLSRFDRIALFSVAGLLLGLALLWGINAWIGLRAPQVETLAGNGEVGAKGPLIFKFTNAMNRTSVEAAVTVSPPWPGRWEWINDQEAYYWPENTLEAGETVVVTVQAGLRDVNGQSLKRSSEYQFTVRELSVVYIGQPNKQPELWRVRLPAGEPEQVTHTDGKVYDFAISPDGEQIVYARVNFRGGTELVLIDRDGRSERTLLDCGEESCVQAEWAPDGVNVAYSRFDSQAYSTLNPATAQLYSLDTVTGKAGLIFANPGVYGVNPKFSPDGNTLGYYDVEAGGIRLVNLEDGSSQVIPTLVTQMGSWSPDSETLVYSELSPEALAPFLMLSKADLANKIITRLDNPDKGTFDYSLPVFSADGETMVVGVRALDHQANKQLWLLDANGAFIQAITAEPMLAHASYHWAPAGEWLVYQQVEIGAPELMPEIVVWNAGSQEKLVLAQDAALPQWMP